jgi:hypothetical protein
MYKNKYLNAKKTFLELKIEKLLLLNKNTEKYNKLLKKTNNELNNILDGGYQIENNKLNKNLEYIDGLCNKYNNINSDINLKNNYLNIITQETLNFDDKFMNLYDNTINKIKVNKNNFNINNKLLFDNLLKKRQELSKKIEDLYN